MEVSGKKQPTVNSANKDKPKERGGVNTRVKALRTFRKKAINRSEDKWKEGGRKVEETVRFSRHRKSTFLMDSRLSKASKTGDIQLLHQLMAENPLLLHNLALTSIENPLHVASLAGHVEFVQEIVKLRPAFVHEMNHDGFSPMHIAAANGYLEVVRELLRVDPRLCRMKGRDQWTPLHYAAARGRGDVVGEMVLACPESLEDVTLHEETSLHLAVNNCQFEAVKILVELVMELRKDNVLNMKDKYGNSVLHVATWKKQHQVVEWIVGNRTTPSALEVNIVNQSGLTPLDLLLIFPSEPGDREIEEILRGAGASRAKDIHHTPSNCPMETNTLQLQQPNHPMQYFKFKKGRNSDDDPFTTVLLVVAVLVATTTFQAGLSPPNGGLHNTTGSNKNGIGCGSNGLVVVYMFFNTIGFSVSLFMIDFLTRNFPLLFQLRFCMVMMYGTYTVAVISTAPKSMLLCITSSTPLFVVILQLCGCINFEGSLAKPNRLLGSLTKSVIFRPAIAS